MADPNIAALSNFKLESVANSIGSSAMSTVLANASGSGQVIEVYSGIISNIDGAAAVDITVDLVKASGAVVPIAYQVTVNPKTLEAVITGQWPVVLQEGDCLRRQAGVGGDAAYVFSYRRYS